MGLDGLWIQYTQADLHSHDGVAYQLKEMGVDVEHHLFFFINVCGSVRFHFGDIEFRFVVFFWPHTLDSLLAGRSQRSD
jgi:hypothetical protein